MLNALKMVVCLNSAVPFDMYSQQFTLCYCLVKSLQKPSSLYSLLKFVYVTSQLSHSLVMQPLLRKILDPPLHLLPAYSSITLNTSLNNLILWFRLWLDTQLFLNVYLDINSTNMSSSKELNLMLFCIAKQDKYL